MCSSHKNWFYPKLVLRMTQNLEVKYITQYRPLFKWVKEKLPAPPFESWLLLLPFPLDLAACLQKRKVAIVRLAQWKRSFLLHANQTHTPNSQSEYTREPLSNEQDKQEHTSQQSSKDPTRPPGPQQQVPGISFRPPLTPSSPRSGSYLTLANAPRDVSPAELKPMFIKHLLGWMLLPFPALATALVTSVVSSSPPLVPVI